MDPEKSNDLPKVTKLVLDFVLILLSPQNKSKCILPPACPLGVWGLVCLLPSEEPALSLEKVEGGGCLVRRGILL